MSRVWVYQTLINSDPLTNFSADRGYQGESLAGAPRTKPFWVYRFGNTAPDLGVPSARRQYFSVYCHDDGQPGDYTQVDGMLAAVIQAFKDAPPSPVDKILEARWIDSSADQNDKEMGTILRYARFQLVFSDWPDDE